MRLTSWSFTQQFSLSQTDDQLPNGDSAFLAPFVCVPRNQEPILINRFADLLQEFAHAFTTGRISSAARTFHTTTPNAGVSRLRTSRWQLFNWRFAAAPGIRPGAG